MSKIREINMDIIYDEDYLVCEPCLSCEKSYTEDIWWETFCDEKECIHKKEYENQMKKSPEERINS